MNNSDHTVISTGATAPLAHTIETACGITTFGRTALYNAIKRGDLKAKKVGRRTIILDADLRAWLSAAPAMHGEVA